MFAIILFNIILIVNSQTFSNTNLNDFYKKWINIDFDVEVGYGKDLQKSTNGIFYQFIYQKGKNSQTLDSSTPLLIWLEGGPGCSSQSALYGLMGPFNIKKTNDDYTIEEKQFSWNEFASILFIDQPFNTGFSYSKQYLTSTKEASSFYIEFIKLFYQEHPQLKNSPTYLTGFSYSGHFVPYYAQKMLENQIPIKGIIVGNGLTDLFNQVSHYSSYLYSNGLINEQAYKQGNMNEGKIQQYIIQKNYKGSTQALDDYLNSYSTSAAIDTANIDYREKPNRNDDWFNFMIKYRNDFKIPSDVKPNICDDNVPLYFAEDISQSYIASVESILNVGRVFIYNGAMDWGMQNGGIQNWINNLSSQYIEDWKTKEKQAFKVKDQTKGTVKQNDKFTFVSLYNAGHVAIFDQGEACYYMIQHFLNNDQHWV